MADRPQRAPERPSFYLGKCREQLDRGMASYSLALRGLTSQDPQPTEESRLGGAAGTAKVAETLVRSHFLLLKVNFELFLQLLSLCAWRVMLRSRSNGTAMPAAAERRLRDTQLSAMTALDHGDVIEAVCSVIIPVHGLEKLRTVLVDAGVDARKHWNARDPRIWAQISTAFAVRHLIEHRNGRTDDHFRRDVRPTWANSSWNTRGPVEQLDRVDVVEVDLVETQTMMMLGLEALEPRVTELDRVFLSYSSG
jgi:hypothetical protein